MGRTRIVFIVLVLLALELAAGLEAVSAQSPNDAAFLAYGASAGSQPTSAQVFLVAKLDQQTDVWKKEVDAVNSALTILTKSGPTVTAKLALGAPSVDTEVHVHSFALPSLKAKVKNSGRQREPKFGFEIEVTPPTLQDGRQIFPNNGLVIVLSFPANSDPFLLFEDNFRLDFAKNIGPVNIKEFTGVITHLDDGSWKVEVQAWLPGDPCCGGG